MRRLGAHSQPSQSWVGANRWAIPESLPLGTERPFDVLGGTCVPLAGSPASFRSLGRMVSAGRHARRGQCGFDRFLAEAHVQQALDAIGPRWGRGFRNSTLGPDHAVSVGVVAREFHQVEGVGVPVRLARLALAEIRRHNHRGDHGGRRRRSLPSNKGMIYES